MKVFAAILLLALVASASAGPAKFGKFGFRSERDHLLKKHQNKVAARKTSAGTATCQADIHMLDGYGDGWSGGELTVLVNGSPSEHENVKMESGHRQRLTLNVNDGDVLSFKYTPGEYSDENEFTVTVNGALLFSEGHSAKTPRESTTMPFGIECGASPSGSEVNVDNCPFRVRKAWRDLEDGEKSLYTKAVRGLFASGAFQAFTAKHLEAKNKQFAHGTSGFLPWHRQFMWDFESSLRAQGEEFACVTLPYWDWSADSYDISKSPIFCPECTEEQKDFNYGPCNTGPVTEGIAKDFGIERRCNTGISIPDSAGIFEILKGAKTYHRFRQMCERNAHNMVHVAVGGNMGSMGSPADPIFYMHHNFVDRIWALWQDCHDYDLVSNSDVADDGQIFDGKNQANIDDVMAGHASTPRTMHSIVSMGYRFAADRYWHESKWVSLCNPTSGKEGSEWGFFHVPKDMETELVNDEETTPELQKAVMLLARNSRVVHKLKARKNKHKTKALQEASRILKAKNHRGAKMTEDGAACLKKQNTAFEKAKEEGLSDDACCCKAFLAGTEQDWINQAQCDIPAVTKFIEEFGQTEDIKECGNECDLKFVCEGLIKGDKK